jgi:putative ABC transport system permease protein
MLELTLVFVVLWFCFDYLNLMIQRKTEPKGFDIEHTYAIDFGIKDEYKELYHLLSGKADNDTLTDIFVENSLRITEKLKQMPEIEDVCYSGNSKPYGFGNSYYSFKVDTVYAMALTKYVSSEYFNVFKIKVDKNPEYDWDNPASKQIIIGANDENNFGNRPIDEIKVVASGRDTLRIAGIANKFKYLDYERYSETAYLLMKRHKLIPYSYEGEISFRVKPSADVDFVDKFTNTIQDKLDIGPFYFINLTSYQKQKEAVLISWGYADNFKNIFFVILFIVINVFLGIFGTFWFRTQSRQSEIGLRCATGSSKKQIHGLIIGEALLMLVIASIAATIISLILGYYEIIGELGVPSVSKAGHFGIVHYLANYSVTIILLSIMALIGTYFPARQAMKIQPSEALRAE